MDRRIRLFINCCLLVCVIIVSSSYSFHEQIFMDNDDVEVSCYSQYFLIEGRSNISLWITFRGIDELVLTEEDIILHGFNGDISPIYINEHGYGDSTYCHIFLSNITNNVDIKEKTIEVKEGVAKTSDIPNSALLIQPNLTFVSMGTFFLISVLVFSFCNILLTILTACGSRDRKIMFWVNAFVLGLVTRSWFIDTIHYNPDYKIILLTLLLITIGLLYHLLLAKRVLGNIGYTFFIIVLSTWSILYFSHIFTWYYLNYSDGVYDTILYHNIILPLYEARSPFPLNILDEQLAYVEFSFRYFFMFPPDEYYSWIAIIQFLMGKIYEMVMLGSIANLILRYIKYKKTPQKHRNRAENNSLRR